MFSVRNFFLTLEKFQFSKRKSLIDHDDSDNINNKHQFYRLAKHQLGMCITPSHLIWLFILKRRDARTFFLILTSSLEHVVCLGESCLSQVNNSRLANLFPAGVANFGKAMYRSVPRKINPGHPGWIFFVQCPGLIFLAARWSGPAISASIFSVFLDYTLRVCKSLRDSFFYLGKLHWFSISAAILLLRS